MKFSTFLFMSLLAGCTGCDINERPERQPESLFVSPLESHINANKELKSSRSCL